MHRPPSSTRTSELVPPRRPPDLFPSGKTELELAVAVLRSRQAELGFDELRSDPNVVKVSVIGVGMRSHAGVAAQMFTALAERGINIQVISTSDIKVSVLIAEEYTELALRGLHTAYDIGSASCRERVLQYV